MPKAVLLKDVPAIAQKALQWNLKNSLGERYLAEILKIDPRLAHECGGGYCDNRVLEVILAEGVIYEQLIFTGFVHNAPDDPGLCPLLLLEGCLTFPIGHADKPANGFYGYRIPSNIDQSVEEVFLTDEIDERVFNGASIFSDASEVIMTDRPMDALVFRTLGYDLPAACMGIMSERLMADLAGSGKKIFLALGMSCKAIEYFRLVKNEIRRYGHTGAIENLSMQLVSSFPELENYDDLITWWKTDGYRQLRKS